MDAEVVEDEDPFEIEDDLVHEGNYEKKKKKKEEDAVAEPPKTENVERTTSENDVCTESTSVDDGGESSKTEEDLEEERLRKKKKKKKGKDGEEANKSSHRSTTTTTTTTTTTAASRTQDSDTNIFLRKELEALKAKIAVITRQREEMNEDNRRLSREYEGMERERDEMRRQIEEEGAKRARDAIKKAEENEGGERTLTQRLVDLGEKNYNLAQICKQSKEAAEKYRSELENARRNLLSRIVDSDPCTDAKHVALDELCNLFVQRVLASRDAEGIESPALLTASGSQGTSLVRGMSSTTVTSSVTAHSAPINVLQIKELEQKISDLRTHNRQQTSSIERMRREVDDAREKEDQLKSYASMCQGFRTKLEREKNCRIRAEKHVEKANERIVGLSEQMKKLTIHLKHESTKKLKEHKRAMRLEREVEALTNRTATLSRKNAQRERVISELREGSKILEDQLRLMDKKYIELRSRLDWTRTNSKMQVKKMQKEANTLRAKWALAGGLDLELLARKSKKKGGKVSKQLRALVETGASATRGNDATEDPEDGEDVVAGAVCSDGGGVGEQKRVATSSVTLPRFPAAARPSSSNQKKREKSGGEEHRRVDDSLPWSTKSIGRLTEEVKESL
eukprot:g3899.t1